MFFEDIQIGDTLQIPERKVEEEEMLAFAGKYNGSLMHTDPEYAQASRAGRITASGSYTFLLMWGYYAPRNFCGEQEIAGTYCRMDFKKPVFAGDTIHGKVIVTDKKVRNPYNGAITVRLDVYNQNDELVLTSESDDIVKRRVNSDDSSES